MASVAIAAVVLGAVLMWAARLGIVAGTRPSEDHLYVVLGIIPGAVVGGRLVHGLAFAGTYLGEPAALFDLSRGAISLLGAVLGGGLAGAYVCRLLGHGVARWADAAALPLLLLIGLGKVALVLGGSGQGAPFDGPWAVAFESAGPWAGPDPGTPAHPAQLYEGLWTIAGLVAVDRIARWQRSSAGGRLFLVALSWWLTGRTIAAFTWRDEPVIGPLGAEQALGMVTLVVAIGALIVVARREL